MGIPGNYPEHRAVFPKPPENPGVFQKARTAVLDPGGQVVLPPESRYVQPELELAVIVGRRGRNLTEEEVEDHIFGYTIVNDITDIDSLMTQWVNRKRPDLEAYGLPVEAPFNVGFTFRAKSWDTFAPLGPCIVTRDAFDLNNATMELRVNGEVAQQGNTGEMITTVPRLLSWVSRIVTLEPGDIYMTGARGPFSPLRPGDVLEHWIEGIGSFTATCVAED
jgi:2-keto-4-pentenoate hydratase/2-oxohepta-3-ene-1,7-dioic acid hydratase in catechol pathway